MPLGREDPTRFLDATQHTVAWFWKRLQDEELDLRPPYQRNPVWQWQQKALLIDSLINGYPVPEIYMQATTAADGSERFSIVDGQQRLRAVLEFIDGKYALGSEIPEYDGYSFENLPEAIRKRVFGYKFIVRSLPSLTEEEIRSIFSRLNRNNLALNAQELRHATYWGPFISSMESFARDPFWIKSGLFTENDYRRMLDIEYISELVIAGLHGLQNKKSRLDYFYSLYESDFADKDLVEVQMNEVLMQLKVLFDWPNSTRWARKVDFYSLFVSLWEMSAQLPFDSTQLLTTRQRLLELSERVSRLLAIEESVLSTKEREDSSPQEHEAVMLYAKGVRNSSDLGSRRLRASGLKAFVFNEDLENSDHEVASTAVDSLPKIEDLMALAPDSYQDSRAQDDSE